MHIIRNAAAYVSLLFERYVPDFLTIPLQIVPSFNIIRFPTISF